MMSVVTVSAADGDWRGAVSRDLSGGLRRL